MVKVGRYIIHQVIQVQTHTLVKEGSTHYFQDRLQTMVPSSGAALGNVENVDAKIRPKLYSVKNAVIKNNAYLKIETKEST